MQTIPRPYGGDIERAVSSFVQPRGGEFLSLNIILSGDSLRRYDKESTRTDSSRYIFIILYEGMIRRISTAILSGDSLRRYNKESTRTDSSCYIFIILYEGMIRRISTATHTHHIFFFIFYYVVISYIYDSTYRR